MNRFKAFWAGLFGQPLPAPRPPLDPETATAEDVTEEDILVAARYNAATGQGRVITNVSVDAAADLCSDLMTVPAPRDRTSAYTIALDLTLRRFARRAARRSGEPE